MSHSVENTGKGIVSEKIIQNVVKAIILNTSKPILSSLRLNTQTATSLAQILTDLQTLDEVP